MNPLHPCGPRRKLGGYHQRFLRVDLDARTLEAVPLLPEALLATIGGVGLGTWLLERETVARLDPFDPRAAWVLAFSPLVGTPLTTSAKFAVTAKSPLTDRLGDSLSSSRFALEAKRTGADAIVVVGQADKWTTLVIDDGRVAFLPADRLLGLSAAETETALHAELGREVAILAIGPAGERLVRYATVSHDGRHAGRGGMGAVLGSKRIKAIAVRGSQRTPLADPQTVIRLARDLSQRSFGPATEKYRELGTVANLLAFNRLAVLPTRNFQESSFEHADTISGEALAQLKGKVRQSCAACTIGCEHIFPTPQGGVRLEYETLFALGSLCGVGDRGAILEAARLCDHYGIDTISFGGTYAFACECRERGLWGGGEPIGYRFGDSEALLAAIHAVARGEGDGVLLAQGSRRLAHIIGQGSLAFAPQVKGLEIPGYDPRSLPMMALGFAVGPRGADHNRSSAYEVDFASRGADDAGAPSQIKEVIEAENRAALLDSLIVCKFLRGVFRDLWAESAEILSAVTGWPWTAEALRRTASHIVLRKRRYNEREGWTREEDTLPKRFLESSPASAKSPSCLTPEHLDRLIARYYEERGLDAEGRLPPELARAVTESLPGYGIRLGG